MFDDRLSLHKFTPLCADVRPDPSELGELRAEPLERARPAHPGQRPLREGGAVGARSTLPVFCYRECDLKI